jgi:hypothetical protein
MTSPLLEARHLVKRFHGITVVDDVSFVVQPGSVPDYVFLPAAFDVPEPGTTRLDLG